MKHKWTWASFDSWNVGFDWERVHATKANPVQEGWMIRLGFGFGVWIIDRWHTLSAAEQDAFRAS